jgi:hypothetical protein
MKRYWPAIVGALLFSLISAGTELYGLRSLIKQGFTHWKFGAEGYYNLSVWYIQCLFLLQAALFLLCGFVVLRFAPKIPWYVSLVVSVVLGLLLGLKMVRLHRDDLHLPKVGHRNESLLPPTPNHPLPRTVPGA